MTDKDTKKTGDQLEAPPKYIRLIRGGVVWQNSAPWPAPPGTEALPFRIGDIFREDDDTWIVFGLPDPTLTDPRIKNADGRVPPKDRAVTRMGDVTALVVIAWLPTDPEKPTVEAFATRQTAATMVLSLQEEALEDWNGDDDDEDDKPAADAGPPLLGEALPSAGSS